MLTEKERQAITHIFEKRKGIVRILFWTFLPFGLLFLYFLVKIIEEFSSGTGEKLTVIHYIGFLFLATGVLAPIYLGLSLAKLSRYLKELPEFKVMTAIGLPKLKEYHYRGRVRAPTKYGRIPLIYSQRAGFIGEINKIKYNLFSIPSSSIGSLPMRFTAISKSSLLLGCHLKRFVIEALELTADEIREYEDDVLKEWPTRESAASLLQNRRGRLSSAQIRRLRTEKLNEAFLWLFLIVGGALMAGFGCYGITYSEKGWLIAFIFLTLLGLFCLACAIYFLIKLIFSKAVAELKVHSFEGQVKKERAATYSEHASDADRDMFPKIISGNETYPLSPDDLFYKIPTTSPMRYYYITKGETKTVINFEKV